MDRIIDLTLAIAEGFMIVTSLIVVITAIAGLCIAVVWVMLKATGAI